MMLAISFVLLQIRLTRSNDQTHLTERRGRTRGCPVACWIQRRLSDPVLHLNAFQRRGAEM